MGIDGEVVDALNKLIEDPHASVGLTLAGVPVTISRTGPDTAHVSGSKLGNSFAMDGHFGVVPGQEAAMVYGLDPKAPSSKFSSGLTVESFPDRILISRDVNKRMAYTTNKPVIVKKTLWHMTATVAHQDAGSYLFAH